MKTGLLPNNFDLIRLFAAVQVMVFHLLYYLLSWHDGPVMDLLWIFPGVPIFFFCSGFLISASWERDPSVRIYALNRALRIYPAYVAALVFSLAGIVLFQADARAQIGPMTAWLLRSLLLIPHFIPAVLRAYGLGVPNGALWTIPVEVFFYATVPLFYRLFRISGRPDLLLVAVILLSVTAGNLMQPFEEHSTLWRLLCLSPVNTIGVFCAGMLAQRHWGRIVPFAVRWVWLFALGYILLQLVAAHHRIPVLLNGHSRLHGLANLVALGGLVLGAAFSCPGLADRVLRRQDISYGIYLLHWPVANMVVAYGMRGMTAVLLSILAAVCLAALSWVLVEKPMLRRKPARMYAHG